MNSVNFISIIGNGVWGNKLQKIIESHPTFSAKVFSMKHYSENTKEIFESDLLWLCLTPRVQINFLEENWELLCKLQVPVIIEKPVATNPYELSLLLDLKLEMLNIYVSEPWTHSEIWKNYKEISADRDSPISYKIVRCGPNERNFTNPPQDWLIHDLYLMFDLLGEVDSIQGKFSASWSDNYRNIELIFSLLSNSSWNLTGGLGSSKQSNWLISLENEQIELDFLNTVLSINGKTIINAFQGDSPVINMIKSVMAGQKKSDLIAKVNLSSLLFLPKYSI